MPRISSMKRSDVAIFIDLINRTNLSENGCLEFSGCVQSNGYSRITIRRKTDFGHRHIFRLIHGEIPKGIDICHRCDNRKCINPNHLFAGTRKDNMQDAVRKGRQARGFKLPGTKLSDEDKSKIVEMAVRGDLYKDIALIFNICRVYAGFIARKHGVIRNGLSK